MNHFSPLLEIKELSVSFPSVHACVRAVNGLDLSVYRGEALAIIGESGSGKTATFLAIMKLLSTPPAKITARSISFGDKDLFNMSIDEWRQHSGKEMSMIFQDALAALNPVYSVGWQIAEVFRTHLGMSARRAMERAIDLLASVGIPDPEARARDYPHQFSGGMRQRVMIAMGIALKPELIIADEPTTALDVTVQAQIMELMGKLRQETTMTLVLITHDPGIVTEYADRVAVMYAGRIVELGAVKDVFRAPAHPYTTGLLKSIPGTQNRGQSLQMIPGAPPNLAHLPTGCAFEPRCTRAQAICREHSPTTEPIHPEHFAECHFARA